MAKKIEERKIEERIDIKETKDEKKDVFNALTDSYTAVSKLWRDSYIKLYKPWLESTGTLFEKAVHLSKGAAPEKYKEFYDEWVKTPLNNFGKLYQVPTLESNKETIEKLLVNAEESNKIYRSWIVELEENSKVTREVLQSEPDPAKYKEVYDLWIKSYGKIFDELLTLPFRQNIKEIFGNITGIPDIYSETFEQFSKQYKDSYIKLYGPWIESILKLNEKSAEISLGSAGTEEYKEFYTLWLNTYQETYGKLFDIKSATPSRNVFESFVESTDIYLNLFRSLITTLERISQKTRELSKQTSDPDINKELYDLWAKTYSKSFDSFFENTPTISPFKEFLEPVKNASKIYADTFNSISNNWVKSYPTSVV
ncbi:hypothetical protein METP1_03502 [Methanosarcinales archaeon]|nr:hypothetical protein METP1_03502 [Methanosarcinales archaeon]